MKHEHTDAGDGKISYGKKFAKTEELYAAHQMDKQLEELAKEDGLLADEAEAELEEVIDDAPDTEGRMFVETRAEPQKKGPAIDEVTRGAPIGAMPPATEPPPRNGFGEVFSDAQRYVGMMRGGVRDIMTGAMRLARLPFEVAVLAAAKLRPLRS